MSRFVLAGDVRQEQFDWGVIGWRCIPEVTGSESLAVLDVVLGRARDTTSTSTPTRTR